MEITLPKRIKGAPLVLTGGKRQITVVGANGSGKTRFVDQMMRDLGDKAYYVSALDALSVGVVAGNTNCVSKQYAERQDKVQYIQPKADTEFEKMLCMMLIDEMADMLAYKFRMASGEADTQMPKTKIDGAIQLWSKVFPNNTIVRKAGYITFSNEHGDEPFSPQRLSHGEKAVLFYIGACLYAPADSVIFVDSPTLFLHPSITQSLWNSIEDLRRDCTFVYQTHDADFPASRANNITIWIQACDITAKAWNYEVLQPNAVLPEQLMLSLIGSRKPVLFVEGDNIHSIDFRLYALIFKDYTIKPIGSCDKVIETVRSFNSMSDSHHLDSWGIVDRDRRIPQEVNYLREKKILVPNVAEVENILLLEGVVRAVARSQKKDDKKIFANVKKTVVDMFRQDARKQALEHTRHRVKCKLKVVADRNFHNIGELENHLQNLQDEVRPRAIYESYCREFSGYYQTNDYNQILRVYNNKSMLISTDVAQQCGLKNKDKYIQTVLSVLRQGGVEADNISKAIKNVFGLNE